MPQVIFFYKMLYILVYLAPTRALEPHEVREEIYKRECRRLNVIPLRSYLRNPIRNTLAVPYCGLGPRGAMALAAPLMVLYLKILRCKILVWTKGHDLVQRSSHWSRSNFSFLFDISKLFWNRTMICLPAIFWNLDILFSKTILK